jgi:hypothetical protein
MDDLRSTVTMSHRSRGSVRRAPFTAWMALMLSFAMLVSACSGSGDGDGAGPAGESPPADATDAAPGSAAVGDADGNGGSYAAITVGDQRFEFDLELGNNGCSQPATGVMAGGGFTEDADPSASLGVARTTGAHVTFAFSPEGSLFGGSSVVVEDFSSDVEWWADAEQRLDQSLVREWTRQGNVVTGTASFVDPAAARVASLEGQPVESRDGTFEVFCAENQ